MTQQRKNVVHFYPTYHFRANEQDPVIDRMQTIMEDAGHKLGKIHEMSGLSTSTLSNWFTTRKTRRPMYSSIAAFARAHGYDVAFVKTGHKETGKTWEAKVPQIITPAAPRRSR
jgi:hypothetical protein